MIEGFERVKKLAEEKFPKIVEFDGWKMLKIDFQFMGKVAGRAFVRTREGGSKVLFNPIFIEDNLQHIIKETIPHELAHIVNGLFQYGYGHGINWKRISRILGCSGERCHSMDCTRALEKTGGAFIAKCGCKEHVISKRKRNNIVIRHDVYICSLCGKRLVVS